MHADMLRHFALIDERLGADYPQMLREPGGAMRYPFLTPGSEQYADVLWDWDSWLSDIALRTGWTSLGTFGRIFRDITGENLGSLRTLEQSIPHARGHVPECVARAADRPDLKTAVSEKRRRKLAGTMAHPTKEAT